MIDISLTFSSTLANDILHENSGVNWSIFLNGAPSDVIVAGNISGSVVVVVVTTLLSSTT